MANNKLSDHLNIMGFADQASVATSISDLQTVVDGDLASLNNNLMFTAEALATDTTFDGTTGLLATVTEGTKVTDTITYDSDNRISGFTETLTAADGSTTTQVATVTYDTLGDAILQVV